MVHLADHNADLQRSKDQLSYEAAASDLRADRTSLDSKVEALACNNPHASLTDRALTEDSEACKFPPHF